MKVDALVENQIKTIAPLMGYSNSKRYVTRAKTLFDGIELSGTSVLDVGCGSGAWVLWSAINGAGQVVGIEPEADGSTLHTLSTLRQTVERLGLHQNVSVFDYFLDQLPMQEHEFDVIVMFNVINHLNEEAVVDIHKNPDSFKRYLDIGQDLRRRIKPGGWLIVADCGRTNFFYFLGLASPVVKTIEWDKHQDPPIWTKVFTEAGFCSVDLRWSPLQPFTRITANWLVQYFTCSHFVLRFRA